MLSMTYGQIRNPQFIEAFSRLANSTMSVKVAYVVTKIARAIADETKDMETVWRKIIEEFAVKGEDGKIAPDEKGNVNLIPEKLEDFRVKADEFHKIIFDAKGRCLQISELEGINLSPSDVMALEGLIVE